MPRTTFRPSATGTRRRLQQREWPLRDRWAAERRRILDQLDARGPRAVPELVGAWAIAPGLVRAWLTRLERDGLVWRTNGRRPGAMARYGLTAAARRLLRPGDDRRARPRLPAPARATALRAS